MVLQEGTSKARYGSDLIVDLMLHYGIEHVALNPGSSFRGLHDSIVNYAGNQPEIIECPHEELAVAIAHGYAKATGKPMAAIVHDVVGLLHATMAIYYAHLDRTPVMVLGATGPMAPTRRRPRIDWIHTAFAQGSVVRDYTKWDFQPIEADDVVDSFARGYRIATADPQGPVYLCYDAAYQEDPLLAEPSLPEIERLIPTRTHPDPAALDRLAGWLVEAENPVLLAGLVGRRPEAFGALVELADFLAAAVVDNGDRLSFPTDHPLNLSGDDEVIRSADLLFAMEIRDLFGSISKVDRVARTTSSVLKPGCRLVEIGFGDLGIRSWSQEFQKLQPVDLSILGDTALALPELLARCRQRATDSDCERFRNRAHRHRDRHLQLRSRWLEAAKKTADEEPIATAHFVSEVGAAIEGTDWVLTANTVSEWARRLWRMERPDRHPGKSLGTATQIGISLGVALAYRGSGRLVVDLQPDGDLLFDAAALWVATHHQIPMLAVMYNNRAYYNDWEHQILIAKERGRDPGTANVGMEIDLPAPDFAGLARSFGWYAEGPIVKPGDVRGAVERARDVVLSSGQPALVDVITQAR